MNEMIGIAICVASGLACFKMFMKCIDWFKKERYVYSIVYRRFYPVRLSCLCLG